MLYDPAAGTVRVDLDDDGDFTDDTAMKPYKDGFQIGHFGTDDPATAVAERIPFVVEIRKDVDRPDGGAGRHRPTSSTSASSSASTAPTSPASPPPTACSAAR